MSSDSPSLSVVIPAYNEADRIGTCLESVQTALRNRDDCEVVLVDSNSTDGTVDVARDYPISIVTIPERGPTTPGAARYVGTAVSSGEFVLFVDGDMELQHDWLAAAIDLLDSRPDVAAVDGHLNEPSSSDKPSPVDSVRGVALYRREALESVGGFDPYLNSVEDIHLGYELTAAGYSLVRLPEMAAIHPTRSTVAEPLRRWKRGYTVGSGQAVRRSLRSPRLLAKHLYRIRHRVGLFVWLCVAMVSVVARPLFPLWLGASAILSGVLVSKLGLREAVSFLVSKHLGIVGFTIGLLGPLESRESFPLAAATVVQKGPVLSKRLSS